MVTTYQSHEQQHYAIRINSSQFTASRTDERAGDTGLLRVSFIQFSFLPPLDMDTNSLRGKYTPIVRLEPSHSY